MRQAYKYQQLRSYTIGLLKFFGLLPSPRFHLAQFLLPGLVALPGLVEAPGELGLELDHPQPQYFVLAEGDAEGVFELVHGLPGGVAAGGFGLDEEGGEGGGRRALLLLGLVGEGPIGCRLLIISADVFLFHSEQLITSLLLPGCSLQKALLKTISNPTFIKSTPRQLVFNLTYGAIHPQLHLPTRSHRRTRLRPLGRQDTLGAPQGSTPRQRFQREIRPRLMGGRHRRQRRHRPSFLQGAGRPGFQHRHGGAQQGQDGAGALEDRLGHGASHQDQKHRCRLHRRRSPLALRRHRPRPQRPRCLHPRQQRRHLQHRHLSRDPRPAHQARDQRQCPHHDYDDPCHRRHNARSGKKERHHQRLLCRWGEPYPLHFNLQRNEGLQRFPVAVSDDGVRAQDRRAVAAADLRGEQLVEDGEVLHCGLSPGMRAVSPQVPGRGLLNQRLLCASPALLFHLLPPDPRSPLHRRVRKQEDTGSRAEIHPLN